MLYLLAILIPPLAVLLCGKPLQALFNLVLTLLLWIPGMLHALFVVHGHYADKRNERAIKAMEKATAAQTQALLEAQKHADVVGARAAIELAEQAQAAGELGGLEARVRENPGDHQARFDLAVGLFGANRREEAFDHLLDLFKRARSWNDDAARKQMVKFFEVLGPTHPLTVASRKRLSSLMFA